MRVNLSRAGRGQGQGQGQGQGHRASGPEPPKCTILIYFTIPQLLINSETNTHSHMCIYLYRNREIYACQPDPHMFEWWVVWIGGSKGSCGRACNLNNEDILLIQEIQLATHTH